MRPSIILLGGFPIRGVCYDPGRRGERGRGGGATPALYHKRVLECGFVGSSQWAEVGIVFVLHRRRCVCVFSTPAALFSVGCPACIVLHVFILSTMFKYISACIFASLVFRIEILPMRLKFLSCDSILSLPLTMFWT